MSEITKQEIQAELTTATDDAFIFAEKKRRFQSVSAKRDTLLDGQAPDPTWQVLWLPAMLAAIGLGIFGAFVAQSAIAGLLNADGSQATNPYVLAIIGATLSIVGMVCGHGIFACIDRHPRTKRWRVDDKFFLYILAAGGYVCLQYAISRNAAGENVQHELQSLPAVIAGIAAIEVVFGMLIAHIAIAYMLRFLVTIRMWMITRGMNRKARSVTLAYGYYDTFVDEYNRNNPGGLLEKEGNENIRRALAYYQDVVIQAEEAQAAHHSGGRETANSNAGGNGRETGRQAADQTATPERGDSVNSATGIDRNDPGAVDSFLDDTIDDNLKA